MSLTGMIEFSKRPSACAAAARCCERAAYSSHSSRLKPSSVAIRSALIPWGTNEVSYAVSGSIAQAPPSEPIGTRDIDSTPPAKIRSSQPLATFWAARLTASSPLAQKRLTCTPATVSGSPALTAAVRAMSAP